MLDAIVMTYRLQPEENSDRTCLNDDIPYYIFFFTKAQPLTAKFSKMQQIIAFLYRFQC